MKLQRFGLICLGLLTATTPLAAQDPAGNEQKARDMLRQVIEEREGRRTVAKTTPPPTTPTPAAVAPAKSVPVVIAPAKPAPAVPESVPAGAKAKPAGRQPTLAEVEQLYLSGKISARQFQKFLRDRRLEPETASTTAASLGSGTALPVKAETNPSATVVPGAPAKSATGDATPPPAQANPAVPESVNDAGAISEVERKMDELLRLKAARDNAALANAAAAANTNSAAAAQPKTRRERLDALLKQYIAGKLSDVEYAQQRAKLLAEPEQK